MNIVETFSPETNFWDEHIQLCVAGPIKELYKKDKSPNKAASSKMMWCIALIWDMNSKFYNLPEVGPDSKIDMIFKDYYGTAKYYENNQEKVEELKHFYIKLQDSPARRHLRELQQQLEERASFMQSIEYDIGSPSPRGFIGSTVEIKEKMLQGSKKIYDLYDDAKKKLSEEDAKEGRVKGGGKTSLSDQKMI